jgi:Transglycosylase SLT domain
MRESKTAIPADTGSVPVMRAHSSWAGKTSFGWVRKSALTILMIVLASAGATGQSISSPPNLRALFATVGRTHNIDPELLEAMADVESGSDPLGVSPKGALGLMQLMPATASQFSVLDPFDPVANIRGAADFLDYLRNRFANNPNLQGLPALLAAYNAGPGAVERYGGIPPYAETNRYVERVIQRYSDALKAQASTAPVLILGPKPYVIQLTGSQAMRPEPVLITADADGSEQNQLTTIRNRRGQVVAVIGTGTAPWTRRNPSELSQHRVQKIDSSSTPAR